MATTTNFGWETPDDTDLVKDGAAAMRTLGNAIDTSLVDLKGGTTGQVLSKASNTDMDFTWTADASGIPATLFDAKGDIIAASAADTAARLAVGTDHYFLQAASGESTGLKWGGAWQAWTPTVSNLTKGNGTEVARYTRIGNTIHFYYKFVFGSTSSMGTGPTITLPVNSYGSEFQVPMNIQDYGTANIFGYTHVASNTIYLYALLTNGTYGGAALVTGTAPMTWTTNDGFTIWGSYEAA